MTGGNSNLFKFTDDYENRRHAKENEKNNKVNKTEEI